MTGVTKKLRGDCTHCGMPIEYPADSIGTIIPCPYCHKPTELQLATPPVEPLISRKAVAWTVVTVVILLLGLAGAFMALKRAHKLAEERKPHSAMSSPEIRP